MRNEATLNDGSSSSTSMSSQKDVEDDKMIALVLSEEYAKLDGAVGRRLANLAPVPGQYIVQKKRVTVSCLECRIKLYLDPLADEGIFLGYSQINKAFRVFNKRILVVEETPHHVPRINLHFPSTSDSSLDYQRLLQRVNVYGLYEVKVSGDGNCQFRALSDQIYRSPEYHKHVRKEVVKQLKDNRSFYEAYVPMKFKHYYKKMAKSGEWGDHVTLQAAADKFAAKICLLTSFRDTCFIEIVPQHQAPSRELWLSFWSEVHYNSLYELQDAPLPRKPRRKHWLF